MSDIAASWLTLLSFFPVKATPFVEISEVFEDSGRKEGAGCDFCRLCRVIARAALEIVAARSSRIVESVILCNYVGCSIFAVLNRLNVYWTLFTLDTIKSTLPFILDVLTILSENLIPSANVADVLLDRISTKRKDNPPKAEC